MLLDNEYKNFHLVIIFSSVNSIYSISLIMNDADLILIIIALVMVIFSIPIICCVCALSNDEDIEDNYSNMEENSTAPTERHTSTRAF